MPLGLLVMKNTLVDIITRKGKTNVFLYHNSITRRFKVLYIEDKSIKALQNNLAVFCSLAPLTVEGCSIIVIKTHPHLIHEHLYMHSYTHSFLDML